MNESLPRRYFEDVYAANDDPWGFETSPYENEKYNATLAMLPDERFRRVFEPGCSIGVLTERLAARCDRLLAVDTVASVLERARSRCRRFPGVEFRQMSFPDELPEGTFDLVVLSEIGYYLSAPALVRAREWIFGALDPGGRVILAHWTPFVADYPLTGDAVHEAFLAASGPNGNVRHLRGERMATYRLDLFERV